MHALIFPGANYNSGPGSPPWDSPLWGMSCISVGNGHHSTAVSLLFYDPESQIHLLDKSAEQRRATAAKSLWCCAAATGLFVWVERTISPTGITWTQLGTSSAPAPLSYTCTCPPRLVSPPLWFSCYSIKGKASKRYTSKSLFLKIISWFLHKVTLPLFLRQKEPNCWVAGLKIFCKVKHSKGFSASVTQCTQFHIWFIPYANKCCGCTAHLHVSAHAKGIYTC